MHYITLVEHLHTWFALLTFAGLSVRFMWMQNQPRMLRNPWVRILPHVNDTCLLATGLTLALYFGYSPFNTLWFGIKLLLLAIYIALGIALFKSPPKRLYRIAIFSMSFITYFSILLLVLAKPN